MTLRHFLTRAQPKADRPQDSGAVGPLTKVETASDMLVAHEGISFCSLADVDSHSGAQVPVESIFIYCVSHPLSATGSARLQRCAFSLYLRGHVHPGWTELRQY